MARPIPEMEMEFPGADSFLDVVTNIVGILIILTVVIGVRAQKAPVAAAELGPTTTATGAEPATVVTLRQELHELAGQINSVQRLAAARSEEATVLATLIKAGEHDLQQERAALSTDDQASYDVQKERAILEAELTRLHGLETTAQQTSAPSVQVEGFPTPLAKVVDQREVHFQLKEGRITYVPINELIDKFKEIAPRSAQNLRDQDSFTDSIGPVEGFYMRYTLVRKVIPFDDSVHSGHGSMSIQLDQAEFIPFLGQQGETFEAAWGDRSNFRARLDGTQPGRWTITLWAYPDSFAEFRELRKRLVKRGYAVAGRPLPDGVAISASPSGSKSAAE